MNQRTQIMNQRTQIILATALVVFGCTLISVAFFTPPAGVIDPTVLTAFGEILTFAGAVIGIDYHYKAHSPKSHQSPRSPLPTSPGGGE